MACATNYPRNDLNVYDHKSANLKFALSTNSITRIIFFLFNIDIFFLITLNLTLTFHNVKIA